MALKRCILEMGMGIDLHGRNYTLAARRAVDNAIRHNSLYFVRTLGPGAQAMRVDVTIGVPNPAAVDKDAVLDVLPYGQKHIQVVKGGLEIPSEDGSDATVMANAAVLVSLDL